MKKKIPGKALYLLPVSGIIEATNMTIARDIVDISSIQMALKNMNSGFKKISKKGNLHYTFDVSYNQTSDISRWSLDIRIKNLSFQLEPYHEIIDLQGSKVGVPKEIFYHYLEQKLEQTNENIDQLNDFIDAKVRLPSRLPDDLDEKILKGIKYYTKKIGKLNNAVMVAPMHDIRYYDIDDNHKLYFDVFLEPQFGIIKVKMKLCVKDLKGQIILLDEQLYALDSLSKSEVESEIESYMAQIERTLREWNRKFDQGGVKRWKSMES